MSRVILQLIYFTIFCLLMTTTATAQLYYVGGEITYSRVTAGGNYDLTLIVNTRCTSPTSTPTNAVIDVDGFGGGTLCGVLGTATVTMAKQSERNITPVCGSGVSGCGGSSLDSITQTIYTGVLNPSLGLLASILANCPNLELSFNDLGRDTGSNTIANNQPFHLEAIIENVNLINNTPTFANDPLIYVDQNGNGSTNLVQYSQAAHDSDGDSLTYSLVNCKRSRTFPVMYIGGRSGISPMSNTHNLILHPITGQITFDPLTVQQTTLCVLVEEYRGATRVGSTVRNIEVIIDNGNNFYPQIQPNPTFVGSNFERTICANGVYQFDFQGVDLDIVNTIDVEVLNLPTGATFAKTLSGNNSQLTINWSPTVFQQGLHEFTIRIFDDNCDLKGVNSYTYRLRVVAPLRSGLSTDDVACRGGSTGTASVGLGGAGAPLPHTYNWSSGQNTANVTNLAAGAYQVTATAANGCNAVRSLVINEPFVNGAIYVEERTANITQNNWVQPNLANNSNNTYAATNITGSAEIWSDFQFSRSSTDAIVGIEVEIEGNDNGSGAGVAVDLFNPTSGIFSNSGYNLTFNAGTDRVTTFGSSADRWGFNWDPTVDINQTGFQVRLTKIGAGAVFIDRIRVRVYYVDQTPFTLALGSVQTGNTIALAGSRTLSGGFFSSPDPTIASAVTGNVFSAVGIAPGTYPMEYTGIDASGCTVTEITQIQVLPAAFNCSAIITNSPVCEGDSVKIEDVIQTHTPAVTSWEVRTPTSGGFFPLTMPYEYSIPNSDAAIHTGQYTVRVNTGGSFTDCPVDIQVLKPQSNPSSSTLNFATGASGFWDFTNNARTNDNQYARSYANANNFMQLNTFPTFNIPPNAIITGVEVEVRAFSTGGVSGELGVQLRSGATSSRVGRAQWNTATPTTRTYGNSNFLWGVNWTPAQLNGPVEVLLSVPITNTGTIEVDYAAVRVHYNIPPEIGITNLSTYTQPDTIALLDSIPSPGGGTYTSQLAPNAIFGNAFFDTRQVVPGNYDLSYDFIDVNGCSDKSTVLLRVQPPNLCGNVTQDLTNSVDVRVCLNDVLTLMDSVPTTNILWSWQRPLGNQIATGRRYRVANASVADSGRYYVILSDGVTVDTCEVDVVVNEPLGPVDSTAYLSPTTSNSTTWINTNNAHSGGGAGAFASSISTVAGDVATFSGFANNAIQNRELLGIEVKVRGRGPGAAAIVRVELSADGGTTFGPFNEEITYPPVGSVFLDSIVGSKTALWGQTGAYWQSNLAAGAGPSNNFVLRLTRINPIGNLYVDHVEVKFHFKDSVNYTLPATTFTDGDVIDLNTLNASPTGGQYQSLTLSNLNAGILTFTPADTGTHALTYGFPDNLGCFSGRTQIITVQARPNGALCGNVSADTAVCVGNSFTLMDGNTTSGRSWRWEKPLGTLLPTSPSSSPVLSVNTPQATDGGTYYLLVNDGPTFDTCEIDVVVNKPRSTPQTRVSSSTYNFTGTSTGWSNPANIISDDNIFSSTNTTGAPFVMSNWSVAGGLPINAEVLGIEVRIVAKADINASLLEVNLEQPIGYSGPPSVIKRYTVAPTATAKDTIILGSPNDLWGMNTLTYANMNSFFRLRIVPTFPAGAAIGVDYIEIKVHYNIPPDIGITPFTTYTQPDLINIPSTTNPVPAFRAGNFYSSTTNPSAIALDSQLITPNVIPAPTVMDILYHVPDTNGCFDVDAVQVRVRPAPLISCNGVTGAGTYCIGDTVRIASTGNLPGVFQSMELTDSTSFQIGPTLTVPIIEFVVDQTTLGGTYTLSIVDSNSFGLQCPVPITIGTPPPASIYAEEDTICQRDRIRLYTDSSSSYNFTWIGPSGVVYTGDTVRIGTAVLNDGGTYQLNIEDITTGCSVDTTIDVVVNPLPSRPIIGANGLSICDGANLSLRLNSTVLLTDTVTWQFNGGGQRTVVGSGSLIILPTEVDIYKTGIVRAVITSEFGCSLASAVQFVEVKPVPTAIVNNAPALVCYDSVATLTANTVNGANYTWYDNSDTTNPSNIIQSGTNHQLFLNNLTADTTLYLAVDLNGCRDSTSRFILVDTMPYYPAIANANINVCAGETVVLTTSEVGNSYTWINPILGQNNNQTVFLPNIQPASAGSYQLRMLNSANCPLLDTFVNVTVRANTQPFNLQIDTICEGDVLELLVSGTGLGVGDSILWYRPDGSFYIGTSYIDTLVIINATDIPNYLSGYWEAVTVRGGCLSNPEPANAVIVQPPVSQGITVNTPICAGDDVILSTPTQPNMRYSWFSIQNTSNPLATGASFVIPNIAQSDTIYLVMNELPTRKCATVDSVILEVNTPVIPTVSIPTIVCEGDTISGAVSLAGSSQQWSNPINGLMTNDSSFIIPSATSADDGIYYLNYVDSNGCLYIDSFNITVNALTLAAISLATDTICEGARLRLEVPTSMTTTVTWETPSGIIINNPIINTSPPALDYQSGIWTVEIVNNITGCSYFIDTLITILERPLPPNITLDTPQCVGNPIQVLTDVVPNAVSYQWLNYLGIVVDSIQNPTLIGVTTDTTIYLEVTLLDGCTYFADSIEVSPRTNTIPASLFLSDTLLVCGDGNIIQSFNTVPFTNPNFIFFWDLPDGSTADTIVPFATATSFYEGWFYLEVEDTVTQCTRFDSIYITLTANTNNGDRIDITGSRCLGNPLSFQYNPIGSFTASPDYIYEWVFYDSLSNIIGRDTTGNNELLINPATSYYDTLEDAQELWLFIIDTAFGCRSNPVTLLPLQLFEADLPIPSTPAPVCLGDSVLLLIQPQNGYSYTWYDEASFSSVVSTSSTFYAQNIIANDTFYVEGTSPQGCQADTFVVVNVVNTQPPLIGGDIEVCEGSDVVIGYNDIGDSYQWSGSNGFNTYDSVFTLRAVTSLDTGTYTFRLVDTNGCQLPDTTLRLIVNPNPVVPIVAGTNSICDGVDTIILFTTNRTATASSDLFWRNGPTGPPLLGDTIRIDKATGGPLYTTGVWVAVTRDSITLCTSSALPYNVQVNPIPVTTITKSGINCGGGNARFQPGLVQAGASYTWYSPDTLVAIDSNTVFTINNLTTDTTVVLEIELNGCTAYAVDSVNVSGNGVVPTLLTVPTVCEGDDVTIGTTTFGRNYEWEDPLGNFITYDSVFVLTGVSTADTGSYTLRFVDSVGCVSLPVSVVLNINPAPPLPIILGDSMVCEGGIFNLSINLNAGDSVWWVNGNNVSTAAFGVNTLVIDSSSFLYQTGTIRALVIASGTGCSILSAPHPITINPIPSTQATSNGPFCDPTNAIFEPAVVVQGATYQWLDLSGDTLGGGPILTINNLSTDTTLVLAIEENGCIGFDTLINTFSIPTIPNLVGTYTGCEGESLTFGTNTYGTNYEWVGPTGFVTYDSLITITDLSALDTGVYTLRFRDSIGCQANDIFVPIGMLATPPVPTITGNTTICEGDTIRLTHTVSNNYLASWIVGTTAITNDTLVVLPSSSNYANTIWTLQVTDSTTGCVTTKDTTIVRNGAPIALISNNGPICIGGDAIFTAPNIAGVSYEWYQGGQVIGSGNSLTINGVTSTTIVTLDASSPIGCRDSNIDSVEVAQGAVSLIANNDTVNVVAGASSTIINVIGNDSLGGGAWTIQIIDPLNLATMNNLNNGSFDLDLTGVNTDDAFTYEVCNPSCAAACDTAMVLVNVDMLGDCMIPNIFTPNADNVNDVFEIPCLSGLGNKLWIFNRWGDLIYETDNYQNNWGGTHNGMAVPDGTYFYILQTNSGEEKQSSIEVRR